MKKLLLALLLIVPSLGFALQTTVPTAPGVNYVLLSLANGLYNPVATSSLGIGFTGSLNQIPKFISTSNIGDGRMSDTGTQIFFGTAKNDVSAPVISASNDTGTGIEFNGGGAFSLVSQGNVGIRIPKLDGTGNNILINSVGTNQNTIIKSAAGNSLTVNGVTGALSLITPLTVANGGTGSTTLSGILLGNGTGVINTLTLGTNLSLTGTTLNATGGGGTGNVSTSSVPVIGQLSYWTTNTATPALLGTVGTSSIANGSGITITNGSTAYVIGAQPTINCNTANGSTFGCLLSADWTTFNNKQPAGNYLIALGNYATTTGTAISLSTTTLSFNGLTFGQSISATANALLFTPTVSGTLSNAGLTNSSVTINTTAPITGGGALSLGGVLTVACPTCFTGTPVTSVSGTYPILSTGGATPAISVAFGTTTANTWSALQTFSNATSTLFTATTQWLPSLAVPAGTFLAVDTNGKIIATSTPAGTNYTGTYPILVAGSVISTAISSSTLTASSPLTGSFAQVGSGGSLGLQAASASQNGYLSLGDFALLHTATTTFSSPLTYTLGTNAVTCPTCLTGNQTVTLSGDVTGSGATAIATLFNLALPHWWTATQNFTNASTSQLTATSSVWLTALATPAGTVLAVDPNGKIIATTTSAGGVTAVTGTYPVISSGGATPAISLGFGTTTANIWSSLQTLTSGFQSNSSSTVVGNLTTTGNGILGGTLSVNGTTGTTTIATGQGFTVGTNQFLVQQGSGNVGIGITNPNTKLYVQGNTQLAGNVAIGGTAIDPNIGLTTSLSILDPTAAQTGANFSRTLSLTSNNSNAIYGGTFTVSASGAFTATGALRGAFGQVSGSNISDARGMEGQVYNTTAGNIASASGGYFSIQNLNAGSTITNAYALKADTGFNIGGKITNWYGLYVNTPPTASTTYGVYVNGTTQSYFGGNVGIGTTTPGSILSVQGVGNFTTATSTLYSTGGVNLTSGCFSIAGTCIGGAGGGSGTVGSGTTGQFPYYASNGTTLTATSSLFLSTSGSVGIGTTTPGTLLSINGIANFDTATSTLYSTTIIATSSLNAFSVRDRFNTSYLNVNTASTTANIFDVASTTGTILFSIKQTGIALLSALSNTAVSVGDWWFDVTQQAPAFGSGTGTGVKQVVNGTLFTQTTTNVVQNTTTETSGIGAGIGTTTVPANWWVVGKTVHISGHGVYGTQVAPGNLTVRLKYNGTTLATAIATTLLGNTTGQGFDFEAFVVCQSISAGSCTFQSGGVLSYSTGGNLPRNFVDLMNSGTAVPVSITSNAKIDVTIQWATASATNIASTTQATYDTQN